MTDNILESSVRKEVHRKDEKMDKVVKEPAILFLWYCWEVLLLNLETLKEKTGSSVFIG